MTTDYSDLLGAYLIGALDNDEQQPAKKHVAENSPLVRAVISNWTRILMALPCSLEPAAPPAGLKKRLLDAIRDEASQASLQHEHAEAPVTGKSAAENTRDVQIWKNWKRPAGPVDFFLQRGSEGEWETTAVPGVEVKKLFVDQKRSYATMLVRMAAGTAYPGHRHAGFEECYVLQGDLHVGDNVLHAGDYQRAEGGSIHGVQKTVHGCQLFIVSSLEDELL
ncbi:hypothetical protein EDS67_16735 [candidate division KSB1 bacterium]|nr:MAG: hypothetical protein EDS67_16735 [candidate division KSB1 bacterium]MBC6951717.1 hypothetical protein [candidate division KSB1 bacterium]MCE7944183.1 hypothetical protein [Chlorobi bacterium CHB1]MDL1878780.1 hypothetical protein [Cytophagia bacterium CHB2]